MDPGSVSGSGHRSAHPLPLYQDIPGAREIFWSSILGSKEKVQVFGLGVQSSFFLSAPSIRAEKLYSW